MCASLQTHHNQSRSIASMKSSQRTCEGHVRCLVSSFPHTVTSRRCAVPLQSAATEWVCQGYGSCTHTHSVACTGLSIECLPSHGQAGLCCDMELQPYHSTINHATTQSCRCSQRTINTQQRTRNRASARNTRHHTWLQP